MLRKISLGNYTDSYIPRIFELVNKGEVKAGQKLSLPNNKTYLPGYNVVVSDTKKEGLGHVKKLYEKLDDGYIHLTKREVENERGAYSRSIDYARGIEKVSLGGQPAFEQQADGRYIQSAFANFPQKIASKQEIESAIDYIKGHGSIENYQKLVSRHFKIPTNKSNA